MKINKNFPNERPIITVNNFVDKYINKNNYILDYNNIPNINKTKVIHLIESIRNYFINNNVKSNENNSKFKNDLEKLKKIDLKSKLSHFDNNTINNLIKEQELRVNFIISFDEFQKLSKENDRIREENKKISKKIIQKNQKITSIKEKLDTKLFKFEDIVIDLQNIEQNYLLLRERFSKNNLENYLFHMKEDLMKKFKELEIKLKNSKNFDEYSSIIDQIKNNKTNFHYFHILYQNLENIN